MNPVAWILRATSTEQKKLSPKIELRFKVLCESKAALPISSHVEFDIWWQHGLNLKTNIPICMIQLQQNDAILDETRNFSKWYTVQHTRQVHTIKSVEWSFRQDCWPPAFAFITLK